MWFLDEGIRPFDLYRPARLQFFFVQSHNINFAILPAGVMGKGIRAVEPLGEDARLYQVAKTLVLAIKGRKQATANRRVRQVDFKVFSAGEFFTAGVYPVNDLDQKGG